MWQLLIPVMIAAGNGPGQYNIAWACYTDSVFSHVTTEVYMADEETVQTIAADTGCKIPLMVYCTGNSVKAYHFRLEVTDYMEWKEATCDMPAKYPMLAFPSSFYNYNIDTTRPGLNKQRITHLISTYKYVAIAYDRAITIQHLFPWGNERASVIDKTINWEPDTSLPSKPRLRSLTSVDTLQQIIRDVYRLDCCYPNMKNDTACIPFKGVRDYCQARANAVGRFLEKNYPFDYVFVVMQPESGRSAYVYDPVLHQSYYWHMHVATAIRFMPGNKLYMLDPSVLAYDNEADLDEALNADLELFSYQKWTSYFTHKAPCQQPLTIQHNVCERPDFLHAAGSLLLSQDTVAEHFVLATRLLRDRCDCFQNFSWPLKW